MGHVGRIGSNRALQVEQVPKAAKGSPRKTAVFKGLRLHKLEQMYERHVINLLPEMTHKLDRLP